MINKTCKLQVFGESLQRKGERKKKKKKDHSWLLAIFLPLFARGRGYGCVVYPSHGAKRQCRSSTHNSRLACQGHPSHGRTGRNICKKAQVRNTAANTFSGRVPPAFWGEGQGVILGAGWNKKAASNTPISKVKGCPKFFLHIKKQVPGPEADLTIAKRCASGTIPQTASRAPVCSCGMQAALADVGTLHNKQRQRAGAFSAACHFALCQLSIPWRYPTTPFPSKVALDFNFSANT